MFNRQTRRSGFTLPEVLVTVAIVAVLAAAVVPTVVNQMGKGDASAVSADLNAIRTGVMSFISDTRRYPRTIAHLNTEPVASSATYLDLTGAQYSTGAATAWRGPYLASTQLAASPAPDAYVFAALNMQADTLLVAPAAANGYHISLDIEPVGGGTFTEAQIVAIDQAIDGGNGAVATSNCATDQTNATSGRLTWTAAGTYPACTVGSVRYRLVPTGS